MPQCNHDHQKFSHSIQHESSPKHQVKRTAVPGIHGLHGEPRRRLRERQHKAQRVDREVQAPALHRHDVDLLRRGEEGGGGCMDVLKSGSGRQTQNATARLMYPV